MRLVRLFGFLIAFATHTLAQERPSWAITDAVDRLVAKNALFLPGGDGFVKFPDGTLTQYELPSKNYLKDGKGWQVELLSRRWRKKNPQGWTTWDDARPQYSAWNIGVIRVDVLASGVKATWVDNTKFRVGSAPGKAEVMQKLDTLGQSSRASHADSISSSHVNSVQSVESFTSPVRRTTAVMPQPSPAAHGLPAGMRHALPQAQAPSPAVSGTVQSPPRPASTIAPVPLPAQAPLPTVSDQPVSGPQDSGDDVARDVAVTTPPAKPFTDAMPYVIGAVIVLSAITGFIKKSKRPSSPRRNPATAERKSPPPQPAAHFPAPDNNPLDLIQRADNLLTHAEQAFFAVLHPIVSSSCLISSKVRLADLFGVRQERGQQAAFNKICSQHIDFVLTETGTSRILCAIELDDSSHNRPDRVERDNFVNELFAANHLLLIRVPVAWTYYPQALRAELLKVGVSLCNAA